MSLKGMPYRFLATLAAAVLLACPWAVRAQALQPEKPEIGIATLQALPQGFAQGITRLQEGLKTWESRVAAATEKLAQTQKELENLQVAVASLKATMLLQKLPLLQVQQLLVTYGDKEKELKGKLKDLSQEIDALKQDQQDQLASENALRIQLTIIQANNPQALTPELQQSFLSYLNLAGNRDQLAAQVLELLTRQRRLLQKEIELIDGLTPPLKQLEDRWKAELLKRPGSSRALPRAGGAGLAESGHHTGPGLGVA